MPKRPSTTIDLTGWISTAAAADLLGVTRRRVQAMIRPQHDGSAPVLEARKVGRDYLVSLASVRAALTRPENKFRKKSWVPLDNLFA